MTKIDIISGFLGAGKTTLIKKLIEEGFSGEKIVLIENEFGEIGIDGGFLKDAGVQINEMNSGCICCSLVGDFGKALRQVLNDYHPDRIIIEPSGVGKLSDVVKAVLDMHEKDITIHSTTVVVDAMKCKMYMKNFGEFFNNQIENASTIVLSRTQKMNDEKLKNAVSLIKEHNHNATIITTAWDDMDGMQIVKAMENKNTFVDDLFDEVEICPTCGHHHDEHHHHEHHHHDHGNCSCSHHHADEVFTSWGVETPINFNKKELEEILIQLSDFEHNEFGMILRAKGIVAGDDGNWIYFDLTPEEYEIRNGQPDVTGKLCVIGSKLQEDKIAELFHV